MEFVEVVRRAETPRIRNYEDWLQGEFRQDLFGNVPDRVHHQVSHHDRRQHEYGVDRTAPLSPEARGGVSRRAAGGIGRRALHQRLSLSEPRRVRRLLEPFRRIADIKLGHEVVRIDPKGRLLHFKNGAPAVRRTDLVDPAPGADTDDRRRAQEFSMRPDGWPVSEAVIVSLGIDRPDLVDAHWSYFYDRDVFLHSSQHTASAIAAERPSGMREPAGRVLLLKENIDPSIGVPRTVSSL